MSEEEIKTDFIEGMYQDFQGSLETAIRKLNATGMSKHEAGAKAVGWAIDEGFLDDDDDEEDPEEEEEEVGEDGEDEDNS